MKGVKDIVVERNIYALIGEVNLALENVGRLREAEEFVNRAIPLSDYDEVLALSRDYVIFGIPQEGDWNGVSAAETMQ